MDNKKEPDNAINSETNDVYSDCLMNSMRVWLEVRDIMSKDVITAGTDETALACAKRIAENSISTIIVTDNGKVIGILTETDFLKRVVAIGKNLDTVKIAEIMSSPVESISPELHIFEASRIMQDKGIKRLPIMEKKQLIGIVTQTDLIRVSASYGMWRDIAEIMNNDVAGVQTEDTVAEAAEIMTSGKISCIAVMEQNKVVGVFTERDLLKRVVALQKQASEIKMEQVMSSPVISIPPDCSIFSASRIMERMDIRRLVVIEDKRLCGIVTQTDIFRAVKKKLQVDTTELAQLRRRLKTEQSFSGIIGRDTTMLELFDTIREVAKVNVPVLIQGESGTGKELVAAAIHNEGPRANKPFIAVNCGALPEGILESELFGHVKGAFTGAVCDRKGRFEQADGGTIFLDEIGDFPPALQVKLLRVLQEGVFQPVGGGIKVRSFQLAPQRLSFQRVGGEDTIKVDVRVISATNKELAEEIAAGRFRHDLFYRLCVVPIHLPPLRERLNDVPTLAKHMLKKALAEMNRDNVVLSPEAVDVMMDYDWPGNIRELENAVRYALVKCRDNLLLPGHLPLKILKTHIPVQPCPKRAKKTNKQRKRKLNAELVQRVLKETGGNKNEAARRLGVSRATLYRFLQESEKYAQSVS